MSDDGLTSIAENLEELSQDEQIPRNVKQKLVEISQTLKSQDDVSIKVNKALDELDEISNDTNLQAFTRTQIWNIASLLESL